MGKQRFIYCLIAILLYPAVLLAGFKTDKVQTDTIASQTGTDTVTLPQLSSAVALKHAAGSDAEFATKEPTIAPGQITDYWRGDKSWQNLDSMKGDTGPQGPPGLDGIKGDTGPAGADGAKGDTGLTGATGNNGPPGLDGAKGDTGAQGLPGQDGAKGDAGIQGIPGTDGATGDTGPAGSQGIQGTQGVQGIQGFPGTDGAKGDTGLTGQDGVKGDTGNQGMPGVQGIQGTQGNDGVIGDTGPVGADGIKGDTGLQGPQGIQGVDGTKGDTGAAGTNATVGPGTSGKIVQFTGTNTVGDATNTNTEVASAVSLKHTQGTDQGLDTGGTNAVTVVNVKDAVTKKHTHGGTANFVPKWGGAVYVDGTMFDSGGKVGIGITIPHEKLEVSGNISASIATGGSATTNYLRLGTYNNGSWGSYMKATSDYANNLNTNLYLGVSNAGTPLDAITILSGGNVGIGTTTPATKLEVTTVVGTGTANNYLRLSAKTGGAYGGSNTIEGTYNDYGNYDQINTIGKIIMTATESTPTDIGGYLSFYTKALGGTYTTAPVERMRINSNGNVGIGTTSSSKLTVLLSDAAGADSLVIQDSNGANVATINSDGGATFVTAVVGNVSNTEIQYLDGVTSAIQTQINTKAPTVSPTFTGAVIIPAVNFPSRGKVINGSNKTLNNNVDTNVATVNFQSGTINVIYVKITAVGGADQIPSSRCILAGFYGKNSLTPTKVGADVVLWNLSAGNYPTITFTLSTGTITISLKQASGYNIPFSYEIEIMSHRTQPDGVATITLL